MTDVKIESVERVAKALEGRNGFIFIQDNALEAATMLRALLDAKEAAEVEAARLQDLVRAAFEEGYMSCADDYRTSGGGVIWLESKSRAALQKDADK